MARYIDNTRSNPANPSVFGEDIEDIVVKALGLGLTELGNSRIVSPITRRFVPGGDSMLGKIADAGSAAVSAYIVGEIGSMLSPGVGRDLKVGGLILAGGKLISALVPGFSISASVPVPQGFPILGAPAAPALPAASSTPAAAQSAARVRSTGL